MELNLIKKETISLMRHKLVIFYAVMLNIYASEITLLFRGKYVREIDIERISMWYGYSGPPYY